MSQWSVVYIKRYFFVPSIPHAVNKEIFLILNATQLTGIRCNTLLQLVQPCSRKVLSDKNVPHCGVILGVIFKHIWNKLQAMSVLHQGVKLGPAIIQGEPTSKCQKRFLISSDHHEGTVHNKVGWVSFAYVKTVKYHWNLEVRQTQKYSNLSS